MNVLEAILLIRSKADRSRLTDADVGCALSCLLAESERDGLNWADQAVLDTLLTRVEVAVTIDEALPSLATLFWAHGHLGLPASATFGEWRVGLWLAIKRWQHRNRRLDEREARLLEAMCFARKPLELSELAEVYDITVEGLPEFAGLESSGSEPATLSDRGDADIATVLSQASVQTPAVLSTHRHLFFIDLSR